MDLGGIGAFEEATVGLYALEHLAAGGKVRVVEAEAQFDVDDWDGRAAGGGDGSGVVREMGSDVGEEFQNAVLEV